MLVKFWNYIKENMMPQPKVQAVPYLQSSLPKRQNIVLKTCPQKSEQLFSQINKQQQIQKNVQPEPNYTIIYKNIDVEQDPIEEQMIAQEVRQLNLHMKQLNLQEKRVKQRQNQCQITQRKKYQKFEQVIQQNDQVLKKSYNFEIVDFLDLKYQLQRSNFPLITYQTFKTIHQLWQDKRKLATKEIKPTNLQSVVSLNYRALGGIDHNQWLNDDVVNIYLQLIDKAIAKPASVKILNSFFATSILPKAQNMVNRYLRKKNIDKQCSLYIPINDKNHWYFARIHEGSMSIYDSMQKPVQLYLSNPIFKNAVKFAKFLYGVELNVMVEGGYPQQDNCYDCGVFMLLGIRDLLEGKKWTFRQGDIRYKRVQMASEIFNLKIEIQQQN